MLAVDTSAFDNIETTALDSIWSNQGDIADMSQALIDNANVLADAAATGDMGATLGAVRGLVALAEIVMTRTGSIQTKNR